MRSSRRFSGLIERTVEFYHRSLLWVLRHQRATLMVTLATLAATIWLYIVIPKGFLPLQDTGLITAVTEACTDVSFDEMQRRQSEIEAMIRAESRCHRRRFGDRRQPDQRHAQCRPSRHHPEAANQRSNHVDAIIARLKRRGRIAFPG